MNALSILLWLNKLEKFSIVIFLFFNEFSHPKKVVCFFYLLKFLFFWGFYMDSADSMKFLHGRQFDDLWLYGDAYVYEHVL